MDADVGNTQLTPLSFLERSADVYPTGTAVVHGEQRISYAEFAAEVTRAARGFQASGVGPGDRVAYLSPNTPALLAAHFAVPLAGAVLVTINTRLAPAEVRYILDHSGARMVVVDAELRPALDTVHAELAAAPELITFTDTFGGQTADGSDGTTYEELLARGSDEALPWAVEDERLPISVNYTSGTTGRSKGVVYTHRGAYLNALGEVIHGHYSSGTVYLWTLPMFHCNGWCMSWAVTAAGGTHVCLRHLDGPTLWRLIDDEHVTNLNGAPPVLSMLAGAKQAHEPARPLLIGQAGGPPNPAVYTQLESMGVEVQHLYGLTETYGPYALCEVQPSWAELGSYERIQRHTRQGVGMIQAERMRVVDEDMRDVPRDGMTTGEIVMRGNNVMRGYLDDEEATREAFRGGWFHSGDIGVMYADGYVELRDRLKDVIVSGGENISTIEVEQAINAHPAVLEAAVIGIPDERWGERPKAFVALKPGQTAEPEELRDFVRGRLAGYKVPDTIELVDELPMTATGKVQKFELRDKEWAGRDKRIQG
jgi:fatty-acyl-CoA synthase